MIKSLFRAFFAATTVLITFSSGWSQTRAIDSLEQRLKVVKGDERILTLGEICFQLYQVDAVRARYYADELVRLAAKVKDPVLKAQAKNDASIAYISAGEFETALRLNRDALKLRTKAGDTTGMVSSYSKIAQCHNEMSRHTESVKSYVTALHLLKGQEQPVMEMQIYTNLSGIYGTLGLYDQAYEMAKDAAALARELKHDMSIVTAQGTQANFARKLKHYDESLRLFEELIPICHRNNFDEYLATIYEGLGVTYKELGRKKMAIHYYHKSFDLYKKIGSTYGMGSVAVNLGHRYADLKQLDKAETYYFLGEKYLQKTGSFHQMKLANDGLTRLYKEKGDYRKSLYYLERSMSYMDSTQASEGTQMLSEMYAKYQTEKKEKMLVQAKLKAEEERSQRWIWSGISGILVISAFFVLRDQLRRRKRALAQIEETKKTEQLRREQELYEQKLSISRELHDNIGSQLTYMISSMDNLTYNTKVDSQLSGTINELSNFGRATMQELRSTIWAMNTEEGSVKLLFRKLEELRSKIPIELSLNNQIQEPVSLKAAEMLNLYRIGQEAMQNALKYSEATKITIDCRLDSDGLHFTVSDNGKGFDPQTEGNGFGLTNMRYRCEQLGGSFHLESGSNGTVISCLLKQLILEPIA